MPHRKDKSMIEITKEDNDSMALILEKMSCAKMCLNTKCEYFNKEEMELFYKSTIDALGAYQWLYKDSWERLYEKYHLDKSKNYYLKGSCIYEQ